MFAGKWSSLYYLYSEWAQHFIADTQIDNMGRYCTWIVWLTHTRSYIIMIIVLLPFQFTPTKNIISHSNFILNDLTFLYAFHKKEQAGIRSKYWPPARQYFLLITYQYDHISLRFRSCCSRQRISTATGEIWSGLCFRFYICAKCNKFDSDWVYLRATKSIRTVSIWKLIEQSNNRYCTHMVYTCRLLCSTNKPCIKINSIYFGSFVT